MQNHIIKILTLLFLFAGSICAFAADNDSVINSVSVNCRYTVEIPQPVSEKIENTLLKTLEIILVEKDGRNIADYIANKKEVETSIIDGLNVVLEPKGYVVESLDLKFAEATIADFVVKPFAGHVKDVQITMDTGSFHPFWAERFEKSFRESYDEFHKYYVPLLTGLPVGAEDSDWAFEMVRDKSYDGTHFRKLFRDMEIVISIDIGETAQVKAELKPSGAVVKTLRVRGYSRSLFQMTLDAFKELATSNSNIVVGMPISLVKDMHKDIEAEFERLIIADSLARRFHAEPVCRLYFLERDPLSAYLELQTESKTFHFSAEAIVDSGNNVNATLFKGHLGAMLGNSFECFTRLNLFPDDVRFRPDIGIGIHPFPGTMLAAGWDISNGVGKLYARQYITRDVHIEAEHFGEDKGQDQYGIIYKPFQFVSFGICTDGDDNYWLRTAFSF